MVPDGPRGATRDIVLGFGPDVGVGRVGVGWVTADTAVAPDTSATGGRRYRTSGRDAGRYAHWRAVPQPTGGRFPERTRQSWSFALPGRTDTAGGGCATTRRGQKTRPPGRLAARSACWVGVGLRGAISALAGGRATGKAELRTPRTQPGRLCHSRSTQPGRPCHSRQTLPGRLCHSRSTQPRRPCHSRSTQPGRLCHRFTGRSAGATTSPVRRPVPQPHRQDCRCHKDTAETAVPQRVLDSAGASCDIAGDCGVARPQSPSRAHG